MLETFLVVDNDSSKRRSGRGGSHGGAGRLACQSPRETPVWLCVHKAGLSQPCVDNDSSKRRSGRGGSHGGAGRLACQSPRETPVWLCVHKAGLSQPCMLSGGPLCGASSLFLHILACVAYFNVYICHIIAVKASMSENGGVWFTLGVQPVKY